MVLPRKTNEVTVVWLKWYNADDKVYLSTFLYLNLKILEYPGDN